MFDAEKDSRDRLRWGLQLDDFPAVASALFCSG